MKTILTTLVLAISLSSFAQTSSVGIPDSAANIIVPGGLVSYAITNPLGHTGSGFVNTPYAVLINPNNVSNQLYFYDLNLNVPAGATVTGVEVTHKHGGCNMGSYTIDSLFLAYNGNIISSAKRDSASGLTTNVSGGSSDLWAASLTPAIVNDNSFGIILQSHTSGICTYSQFDLQVNVYYCTTVASVNALDNSTPIAIYPNPTESLLSIVVPQNKISSLYTIFDYSGKLCQSGRIKSNSFVLDVSLLPAGFYVIKIDETNLKFIKK